MKVSRDVDLIEIESLLSEKLGNELTLSQAHKKSNLVFLSRFLQSIITFSKRSDSLVVYYPHLDCDDQSALDGLVSDPMALVPIVMTKETFVKGHTPVKGVLNRRLVERFNQSEFKGFKRYLQMIAVDHSIEKYAYPESMYRLKGGETTYEFRSSSYFDTVLQDYLKTTFKVSSLADFEVTGIGELLYELLLNTEQHAKFDYKMGVSKRSVRGAILNAVTINTHQELSIMAPEETSVYKYLSSLMDLKKAAIHILEISVFDSGPGIAKSFPGQNVLFKDEIEVFLKSFMKGVTSKVNGIGMGRGLPKALNVINGRGGYIGIRSGRLSVYRNLLNAPITFIDGDIKGGMTYMDEMTESSIEYSEMAPVEGVAYSILVPVK